MNHFKTILSADHYYLISRNIASSTTEEHLNTCERMTRERLQDKGYLMTANDLYRQILLKRCELLINERYPVTE